MVSPKRFRAVPAVHSGSGIDLGALRAFVAVAQTGSFIAGGKSLGLTRSAVGKALARLETHLGTRLLHRTTRRVAMTTDGELFYERCTQVLADLDDAEASIRQERPEPKGVLRMTVSGAFGRIVVLPVLRDYLAAWPRVEAEVSFSDRVVDLVEEGYDLGIRVGGVAPDSSLVARVVARSRPGFYAAPTYLASRGEPERPADLSKHERLLFGSRTTTYPWTFRTPDGERIAIEAKSRCLFDSGEAIRDAAVTGMGIAFLPDFVAKDEVDSGRLRAVLTSCVTDEIAVFAVYPHRRHLSARVRVFIDMLTEHLDTAGS
ncbi:MAG: HTH-type transcriptional regulator DmlR [Luteibacter sp.]|nr:MAG: HTH-type transcriptional regulator DmlR [Luteibacter sp.]